MPLALARRKILGMERVKTYQGKPRGEVIRVRKEHKHKHTILDATCLREEDVLTQDLQHLQREGQACDSGRLAEKLRCHQRMGNVFSRIVKKLQSSRVSWNSPIAYMDGYDG